MPSNTNNVLVMLINIWAQLFVNYAYFCVNIKVKIKYYSIILNFSFSRPATPVLNLTSQSGVEIGKAGLNLSF